MSIPKEVQLSSLWPVGPVLKSGGFAHVYLSQTPQGEEAVLKFIPKEPGAARELLFESLAGAQNIIPVLDSGETSDYYVIAMPRAQKSLRDMLNEKGGRLTVEEAVPVLEDVAVALESLSSTVVHRDLKPENLLLYNGRWCIADFGIARYADATTAADTRKFAKTIPYAAPEQWRGERATPQTDVYAFGVIAYELTEGRWPFFGPDFRAQHLTELPPALSSGNSSFASLVQDCLSKAPGGRPTPQNIQRRLAQCLRPVSAGLAVLQAANRQVVERNAAEAAQISAARTAQETQNELFETGAQSLGRVIKQLKDRISDAASSASFSNTHWLDVELNGARLRVFPLQQLGLNQSSPTGIAFDIVACCEIEVRTPQLNYGWGGRSHSLWYCDAQEEGVYRWYEMAFMASAFVGGRESINPFALNPGEAAIAFSNVMGTKEIARKPVPIDQGDEDEFIARWIQWFGEAAVGKLQEPRSLPEETGGTYRRS